MGCCLYSLCQIKLPFNFKEPKYPFNGSYKNEVESPNTDMLLRDLLLTFPNLIVQILPIITPLIMDQLTCSLPKNLSNFHGDQDGISHFCLSPYKLGVFGTLNNTIISGLKIKILDFGVKNYWEN